MQLCLLCRRAAVVDKLVDRVALLESLSVLTRTSSSTFNPMTIVFLEPQRSRLIVAAAKTNLSYSQQQKVPRVADSWSDSSSSSSETGSEASEENFVSDDSDESDDEPANEKTMVDMEEDLSAGCGYKPFCRLENRDSFDAMLE